MRLGGPGAPPSAAPLIRLLAVLAAGLAIVGVLRLLDLQQALLIGAIGGAAYGFVALGLVLVFKSSGVFNFTQGEFGTVAVYTLWLLHSAGAPYALALLGALAAAVVMGLAVERLVVRPLFDAPRVTLLVATAGVALLAIGVQIWFGQAKLRSVAPALTRPDRVALLGRNISDQQLLLVAVLVVLGVLLALFFSRTDLGLAILAASEEPTAVELVGVSVRRLSSITWGLAALLGGLAGVLYLPVVGTFAPGALTTVALIPGFTAAVVGGMTSLPGAVLGGVVVGVAQAAALSAPALRGVRGAGALMVFVLLVAILAVRPQGLLGKQS